MNMNGEGKRTQAVGLYTEIVMEHFRSPRNRTSLSPGEALAEESNPLCGDRIRVSLKLADGRIADLRYDITGCALSTASASVMSCLLQDRTLQQARQLMAAFRRLVGEGEGEVAGAERAVLGEAVAFEQVRNYPVRRKCVLLPWRALEAALARFHPQ